VILVMIVASCGTDCCREVVVPEIKADINRLLSVSRL
jgi:hypothetical protein